MFITHLDLGGIGDHTGPEVHVNLYQFGQENELVSYRAKSDGRLTRCHFDPYGSKFAGADTRGDLHIWKFDAYPEAMRPGITLRDCHQGPITEFTFLESSSVIATAGMSSTNM